ncbi:MULTISPECIES: flavin reductase family protein [unclassified Granulicatella]|uniref:flavin reductase family protein n=1 Tax=unclassified Granulicatella TaxID=2630493 RepID=UPI0013D35CF2|nr:MULTISPECIES: flavin reductase family protein [unclassified Granulicatella]MBS4751113.1 flavin reductase family protein [Carnobacteriaceae bacterium zg-ZUI78]QMI85253.1 flavin reductase family protein [Carnobacteriaceae bacterium zg-84]
MKKVHIETNKLFYGSPVVLIGYKDELYGYNVTTINAAYTVSNTVAIALYNGNHSFEEIKKTGQFTLNVPDKNQMELIELFGFNRGKDKLNQANTHFTIGEKVDAPILTECFYNVECQVVSMTEVGVYTHILATIEERWIDEECVDENGHLIHGKVNPVEFVGDSKKRAYRYLTSDVQEVGAFKRYLDK